MCAQTRPRFELILGDWKQNPSYLHGENPFCRKKNSRLRMIKPTTLHPAGQRAQHTTSSGGCNSPVTNSPSDTSVRAVTSDLTWIPHVPPGRARTGLVNVHASTPAQTFCCGFVWLHNHCSKTLPGVSENENFFAFSRYIYPTTFENPRSPGACTLQALSLTCYFCFIAQLVLSPAHRQTRTDIRTLLKHRGKGDDCWQSVFIRPRYCFGHFESFSLPCTTTCLQLSNTDDKSRLLSACTQPDTRQSSERGTLKFEASLPQTSVSERGVCDWPPARCLNATKIMYDPDLHTVRYLPVKRPLDLQVWSVTTANMGLER